MKKIILVIISFTLIHYACATGVNTALLKASLNPAAEIKSVKKSAIPGLYEVQINNQIVYLSADGEKVITGDIYDLKKKRSYTSQSKNNITKATLTGVSDSDKIIYKAKDEKHKILVFTDISCPYCVKLHEEVEDLNDAGVTVEYLAFPRAGVGSQTQKNLQKIWCADDKTQALTDAKMSRVIPKETCSGNQVTEQFLLGQDVGVNATPTIVFADGELYPGYMKANEILDILKGK